MSKPPLEVRFLLLSSFGRKYFKLIFLMNAHAPLYDSGDEIDKTAFVL
jgi:hypothetical protein